MNEILNITIQPQVVTSLFEKDISLFLINEKNYFVMGK